MRLADGNDHPRCLGDAQTVISRHATSEGLVVYRRCGCGALQVELIAEPALIASSTPPACQHRHAG